MNEEQKMEPHENYKRLGTQICFKDKWGLFDLKFKLHLIKYHTD